MSEAGQNSNAFPFSFQQKLVGSKTVTDNGLTAILKVYQIGHTLIFSMFMDGTADSTGSFTITPDAIAPYAPTNPFDHDDCTIHPLYDIAGGEALSIQGNARLQSGTITVQHVTAKVYNFSTNFIAVAIDGDSGG